MWGFIEFACCFYDWSFEVFRLLINFIWINLASLDFTMFYSIFMFSKQYVCKLNNITSLWIQGCYRLFVFIRFFLLFLSLGLYSHECQAFPNWRRRWRFPFSSTLTSLPPYFTIFKRPWELVLVVLLYTCWGLARASPTLLILFAFLIPQLCQSHSWLLRFFKVRTTNRLCWKIFFLLVHFLAIFYLILLWTEVYLLLFMILKYSAEITQSVVSRGLVGRCAFLLRVGLSFSRVLDFAK